MAVRKEVSPNCLHAFPTPQKDDMRLAPGFSGVALGVRVTLFCHWRSQRSATFSEIHPWNSPKSSLLFTVHLHEDTYDNETYLPPRSRFHHAEEILSCSNRPGVREAALGQTVHYLFTIHSAKLKCEDLIVIFKSTCCWLSFAFLEIIKKKKKIDFNLYAYHQRLCKLNLPSPFTRAKNQKWKTPEQTVQCKGRR